VLGQIMGDEAAKKAIDNHIKHEEIVDATVKALNDAGIHAEPTQGNNPKGDIQIPADQAGNAEKVIKDNIKSNRDGN